MSSWGDTDLRSLYSGVAGNCLTWPLSETILMANGGGRCPAPSSAEQVYAFVVHKGAVYGNRCQRGGVCPPGTQCFCGPRAGNPRGPARSGRRPGRRDRPTAGLRVDRLARLAGGRAGTGQDADGQGPGRRVSLEIRPHPVHARPHARRRDRLRTARPRARTGRGRRWCFGPARCSPTSCWPTRSTARPRRRSRPCWRRWPSGTSPWAARPIRWKSRSWWPPRRIPSSRKGRIRCPRRSWTAS